MTKPILSILNPCSENWESFSQEKQGKFCGSCSKIVMDFTRMNNQEIIKYLEQNKNSCGRISKKQLLEKRAYIIPLKRKKRYWSSIAAMLVMGMFVSTPVFSQIDHNSQQKNDSVVTIDSNVSIQQNSDHRNVLIKGKIISQNTAEELVGVTIQMDKTTIGTITDLEGNFVLTATKEELEKGIILQIEYIGYETLALPIPRNRANEFFKIELKYTGLGIYTMGYFAPIRIKDIANDIGVPINSSLNDYMLEYQKNEYLLGNRYSPY